jgi:hypothetical protein
MDTLDTPKDLPPADSDDIPGETHAPPIPLLAEIELTDELFSSLENYRLEGEVISTSGASSKANHMLDLNPFISKTMALKK